MHQYLTSVISIFKFKPDFIFWAQKGKQYLIHFVDPKGTEHKVGLRKIDGYSKLFEQKEDGYKKCKDFLYDEFIIHVKLLLKTNDKANVPKNYESYLFDYFDDFGEQINLFVNYDLNNF